MIPPNLPEWATQADAISLVEKGFALWGEHGELVVTQRGKDYFQAIEILNDFADGLDEHRN